MPTKILGVIPARFASTRFPGKALSSLAGKPIIQHVFERVSESRSLTRVVIATDDERIAAAAQAFGAPVEMTSPAHSSGTDRVAEVASRDDAEIIVNIQGDEPLIDPAAIDAAIDALADAPMSTLKKRIDDWEEAVSPNVVKVVTSAGGDAIYFSRATIPHDRDRAGVVLFKHIGLYVYRRDFLLGYSQLLVGPLEKAEKLEQLRALENGYRIRVAETSYESIGVDTPADLERVRELWGASRVHG